MVLQRHGRAVLVVALLMSAFASGAARAQERDRWSIEPSLYLFLPGLSGTVGIGPIDIDLDSPSEAIVHINFGAMGSLRVAYGAWALNTDVMYADLTSTKGNVSANVQQLVVEPTIGYRVLPWLEPLAGIRYERVGGDITGPFGHNTAAARGWVDPIVGVNLGLAISDSVSLRFRGDVGGFGIGSTFTWQAFPFVTWRVADILSLQAGYRVLSVDYEDGAGVQRVHYDVVELGPQLGLTFHFAL